MRTLWLIVGICLHVNLFAWEISQTKLVSGQIIFFERVLVEEKIYDSLMDFCCQNRLPQEDAKIIVHGIIEGPLKDLFVKKTSTMSLIKKETFKFCKQEIALKEVSTDLIEKIQAVVEEADLEKIRKKNLRLSRREEKKQKTSFSLIPLPPPTLYGPEEDIVRQRGGRAMSMQDVFPGGDDDLLS